MRGKAFTEILGKKEAYPWGGFGEGGLSGIMGTWEVISSESHCVGTVMDWKNVGHKNPVCHIVAQLIIFFSQLNKFTLFFNKFTDLQFFLQFFFFFCICARWRLLPVGLQQFDNIVRLIMGLRPTKSSFGKKREQWYYTTIKTSTVMNIWMMSGLSVKIGTLE